jgi:delta24-sterol reductase
MQEHKHRVALVSKQVKGFWDLQEPFRIYHGSTYSTRFSRRERNLVVDISLLNNILEINIAEKSILVEANVSMDKLVDFTIQHRLIPPVVPEIPGITVGGVFVGLGGESSSFRHGPLDRNVRGCEVVLANGEIRWVSPESESELFDSLALSYGTLGVVTLLKLSLMDAKDFVELSFQPTEGIDDILAQIWKTQSDRDVHYVEAMLYSAMQGIVISGRMKDTCEGKLQTFSRAKDPYFYMHARHLVSFEKPQTIVQTTPLRDYIFRHDRGVFWMGKEAFEYFGVPFNAWTRWALDYFMNSRKMIHAYHKTDFGMKYVCRDFILPNNLSSPQEQPYRKAKLLLEFLDSRWKKYPIHLCPGKVDIKEQYGLLKPRFPPGIDTCLGVGVYGSGPTEKSRFVDLNRKMEDKVDSLGGIGWIYSLQFREKAEEFWKQYDQERYVELRTRFHATKMFDIWDKVKPREDTNNQAWLQWLGSRLWRIWPLDGLYGVASATLGGDFLLTKSAPLLGGTSSGGHAAERDRDDLRKIA